MSDPLMSTDGLPSEEEDSRSLMDALRSMTLNVLEGCKRTTS